jgi:hypothetical protein
MVVEGRGLGVVVRTGDHTMIGQIAALVGQTESQKSTLEVEVEHFVHVIALLAVVSAVALYVVAAISSGDWLSSFINVFVVVLVVRMASKRRQLALCSTRHMYTHTPVDPRIAFYRVRSCVYPLPGAPGQCPGGPASHRHIVPHRRGHGGCWVCVRRGGG